MHAAPLAPHAARWLPPNQPGRAAVALPVPGQAQLPAAAPAPHHQRLPAAVPLAQRLPAAVLAQRLQLVLAQRLQLVLAPLPEAHAQEPLDAAVRLQV